MILDDSFFVINHIKVSIKGIVLKRRRRNNQILTFISALRCENEACATFKTAINNLILLVNIKLFCFLI
jgi:hypothetical protein